MRFLFLWFCSLLMTTTANADETKWGISLGGGVAIAPQYSGDDDYAVLALPFARVTYDDVFYASIPEGANLKLFDEGGLSVVSTAKFIFDREEDGDAPFQIGGSQTTDLIGLGDVSSTIELGGALSYGVDKWTLTAAMRQGLGGHDGLIGELSARYSTSIRGYGPPIRLSLGPSLNFGDTDYMNAYYGVTAAQSAASGLSPYRASGGLYSVGLSFSATAPVSNRSAIFLQGSLSQLTGNVKDAPLVTERGSRTQAFGGVFWVYTFGQDARRGRRPA